MKTLKIDGVVSSETVMEISRVLKQGGIACIPCNGTYRMIVDLWNVDAVLKLLQSKRRVKKKPSLVFISDPSQVTSVASEVTPLHFKLIHEYWPGPLTLLFTPHPDLPRKISKELTKANGNLGVRVPVNPIMRRILSEFGGPVLASSANRNSKIGETSSEQIKRNFSASIDIFLDAGDLNTTMKSTVVEVNGEKIKVIREGLITRDMLEDQFASAV